MLSPQCPTLVKSRIGSMNWFILFVLTYEYTHVLTPIGIVMAWEAIEYFYLSGGLGML